MSSPLPTTWGHGGPARGGGALSIGTGAAALVPSLLTFRVPSDAWDSESDRLPGTSPRRPRGALQGDAAARLSLGPPQPPPSSPGRVLCPRDPFPATVLRGSAEHAFSGECFYNYLASVATRGPGRRDFCRVSVSVVVDVLLQKNMGESLLRCRTFYSKLLAGWKFFSREVCTFMLLRILGGGLGGRELCSGWGSAQRRGVSAARAVPHGHPGGACVWSACGAHDSQPRHLGRPVRIRPYWPLGLHKQTPPAGAPSRSGGCKSKVSVLQGWLHSEALLLACRWPPPCCGGFGV